MTVDGNYFCQPILRVLVLEHIPDARKAHAMGSLDVWQAVTKSRREDRDRR